MGKIIITEEQNGRIKSFLKMTTKADFLENHIKGWTFSDNECLKLLSVDKLARILYEPGSYEVEKPKFEIGEKVMVQWINKKKEQLFEIEEITDYRIEIKSEKYGKNSCPPSIMRKLTKKEAIWAELDRGVGQFVDGDCINEDGKFLRVSHRMGCDRYNNHVSIECAKDLYRDSHLNGFYPANSFIKLS